MVSSLAKKRFLVTGAGGQLGAQLVQELAFRHGCPVIGWTSQNVSGEMRGNHTYRQVDITDRQAVEQAFHEWQPDCVIHCAAVTNVDLCERDREIAKQVNTTSSAWLAELASRGGAKFAFLSSDYVFDGSDGPYDEDARVNPINYYGVTKAAAEQIICEHLPDALILRTTVLYSNGRHNNFLKWVVTQLQMGAEVRAFTDQYGNPTWVDGLARAILDLIALDCQGIYHVAGPDWVNRYTFALQIATAFGLPAARICPVTAEQLPQTAKRPVRGGFRVAKSLALTEHLYSIDESLQWLRGGERAWTDNMMAKKR
jgi:dTDP-4-dehydrorhamnose reductase